MPAGCPGNARTLVERFIAADCMQCWTQAPPGAPVHNPWTLDWIVPSPQGDDAELAAAALSEAQDRLDRQAGASLPPRSQIERRTTLAAAPPRVDVTAGPAWHGYIGVQFDARGTWPRRSVGWVALVEAVPVGIDGTPVARRLVRVVSGPLDLDALRDGAAVRELRALRWPETARPARLQAMAWIEAHDGRIVAVAGERCPSPRPN